MGCKTCATNPNYGKPIKLCPTTRIVTVMFQQTYKDNGDLNRFLLDVTDQFVLNDALSDLPDSRLYPLKVENMVVAPREANFEATATNVERYTHSSPYKITAERWSDHWLITSKINSKRCGKWSVYFVTDDNQLIGQYEMSDDGASVRGLEINADSVFAAFSFAAAGAVAKNMIQFQLDENIKDSAFYSLDLNDVWNLVNNSSGVVNYVTPSVMIIDADLTVTANTATTISFNVNDQFRDGFRIPDVDPAGNVKDLVLNNFLGIKNKTTGSTIVATLLTEPVDGSYVLTIPAQTAGDIIELNLKPTLQNNNLKYEGKTDLVAA